MTEINSWQIRTGTSINDLIEVVDIGGGSSGLPQIDASQLQSLNASQLSSGTVPDARISQSNITQHEDALAIDLPQLTQGGATDGQVLTWNNSAGEWQPKADTDTRTDVSDNGTLTVSAVSDINFSSYLNVTDDTDGSVTVDVPATGADSNLVSGTAGTSGNLIEWNADGDAVDSGTATSNLVLTSSSIDALSDVDTTTTAPSSGDVLEWDGSNWVPAAASTDTRTDVSDDGTTIVSGVSDINFSSYLNVTDDTDGTVTINVPATGADSNLVSGTAGTSGNLVEWNADGDAVDSGTATSNVATASTFDWITVSSNTTVSVNDRIFADTSGGAITITLPGSPTSGNQVRFVDPGSNWNTNSLTVDGNGNNIEGSSTFTATTNGGSFHALYNGTQWVVRFGTGG